MGLKIGVVGAGYFSRCFFTLLKVHPLVDEVSIADLVPERREKMAARFGITKTYDSLESICKSDVDAVMILTQRHLHGPHVIQALKAGKHVYCAVPLATSIEDIAAIIDLVKQTKLTYMTGETSYYLPSVVYCRDRFAKGDFGDFVYGESCYTHDLSHGFYEAFQYSGGDDWKRVAGVPPMYYPTHSVSMIMTAVGTHATHVSCLGYKDKHEDEIFRVGNNNWDNPFSNETALMRTADGGMCRINEFRRVGWSGRNGNYMSIFGTLGSFEEHAQSSIWLGLQHGTMEDVTEMLDCKSVIYDEDLADLPEQTRADFSVEGYAKVHPVHRLPSEFEGKPNGHFGSHQFLVDDFVKAVASGKLPPNHVWNASRYCVPGLVAHESAMRDGEMLKIPDFGEPPADWDTID